MLVFCENQFKEIQTSIIEAAWICVDINVTYDTQHEDFPMLTRWDYLLFHSDWNWLMEAVEFIEKRNYTFIIEDKHCYYYKQFLREAKSGIGKSKKEAVFLAVSDFAKLYNEEKL
jgi:hypothetical protein